MTRLLSNWNYLILEQMHKYNYQYNYDDKTMGKNDVSIKKGITLYVAGFACVVTGLFYLSTYLVPSWYYTLLAIVAFVAGGLIWYLSWLMHVRQFPNLAELRIHFVSTGS